MCWSNYMATPIVLKKPLKVYKVGTAKTLGIFISLYQNFRYYFNDSLKLYQSSLFEIKTVNSQLFDLWTFCILR